MPDLQSVIDTEISHQDAAKRLIVDLQPDDQHTSRTGSIALLIELLARHVRTFKIGYRLTVPEMAWPIVHDIEKRKRATFYDGKFHDTPETVAAACAEVARRSGVSFLTVHVQGGRTMMKKAANQVRRTCDETGLSDRPQVLGVTLLTSLSSNELYELGVIPGRSESNLTRKVVEYALLAQDCGLDGVVVSPWEVLPIKERCGTDFLVITPGIRPAWHEQKDDDQRRTMTPSQAINQGADYLVVGRPITTARLQMSDPIRATQLIISEIAEAVAGKP